MKVVKVETAKLPLPLRESYTIAYHTVSSVTNVVMLIHTHDGSVGVGISGPEEEVTGETPDTVVKASEEIIKPYLLGRDISDITHSLLELDQLLGGQRAALALADTALFHLASKKSGMPLHKYLGAKREGVPTAITIYIHPPEETVFRCVKRLEEGFKILKIKGGLDPQEDLLKLTLLRQKIGFDVPLILDLNQGYSEQDIRAALPKLSSLKIVCIEQPTKKEDKGLLVSLTKEGCKVMVDESLVTTADAEYFGEHGVPYFNLKLMKAGGIHAVMNLDKVASRYGVKVITSCMDEAALANAYGLAFSLASPNVSFVDLDSYTDYSTDPTRDAVRFHNGMLYATEVDPLGWIEHLFNKPQNA